jgi:formylmethanofuran dehydrogenase subunit B
MQKPDNVRAQEFENVPCPFCGLLCDDLGISAGAGAVTVSANGCAKSRRLFAAHSQSTAAPLVGGQTTTLDAAIVRATSILRAAKRPLLLSAGTDVAGMRALIELAELTKGIVDHANREAMFRNLRVLQDTGWISTTLTEMRNRADLLVVAGTEVSSRFPRLFERCFGDFDTLFDTRPRELVFLGAQPDDLPAPLKSRSTSLDLDPSRIAELFGGLRALLRGRPLLANDVAGISIEKVAGLLARMGEAKYGVLTWAAAEFDFANADLAVQAMCELVKELNGQTRFAVLPLGGSDGDLTAMQVTTWQTGFPVCVDFGGGIPSQAAPDYPPPILIERGEVDALLLVSALDVDRIASSPNVPSVVLGRSGMSPGNCSVYIPVSVPGLHHAGHLYRTDNVVAMHMRQLVASAHPAASEVLQKILDLLRGAG